MKEFMLLIRNTGDSKMTLNSDKHFEFVKQCEVYIEELRKQGRLIAAQPLIKEGVILSSTKEGWKEIPFDKDAEGQAGYYHILAKDLHEAINIAKDNPEFEYVSGAKIEVRPVKMKEESTHYVYPAKKGSL
jgi:hypothetical protein